MPRNYLSWFLLVSLCWPSPAKASGFLATGPGARAAAMGGAYTALPGDPAAIFYNPAGLTGQQGGLMLEHVPINEQGSGLSFGDGRLDFVGIQYPSKIGTFALGWYQFAIGGIQARENLGDPATTISVTQTAYFVPYAVQFGRLSLGVTGKAVNYNLGTYQDTGLGTDVGARAEIFHRDTFLGRDTQAFAGVAVRNALAPKLTLYEDPTAIEQITTVGVALTSKVREHYAAGQDVVAHDRFTLNLDFQRGNMDTPLGGAVGFEYSYLGRYSLRAGYSADQNLTFGLGMEISKLKVDYAANLVGLAPQHHLSLSWYFTDPPAQVESDVHLSEFRRATLDQERLKDRFLREGREAAAQGDYETALADYEKAQVMDPADQSVAAFVASATEGSRLAGVKVRLDASRRERAAHNDDLASKEALDAVQFDPQSREAADFAVELRNQLISTGTVRSFDAQRGRALEENARKFEVAYIDQNMGELRRLVVRIRALSPDDAATWKPLVDRVFAAEKDWCSDYAAEAARDQTTKDVFGMARAIRRIRRINDAYPQLGYLVKRLKKLSKAAGGSFYNRNYLQQLYDNAAADYVLGNYEEAAKAVKILLNENALHEAGNALIDRMRDEGHLSFAQEP